MSKHEYAMDQCCMLLTHIIEWRVVLPEGGMGFKPFGHRVKGDVE